MSNKSQSAKLASAPTTPPTRDPATKPSSPASKTPRAASMKEVKPSSPGKGATRPAARIKPSSGKLSALDAAAKILQGLSAKETATGISTATLIERMAEARLWSSPGGKTPAATLYAAMVREIAKKDGPSRFRRVSPGHFTLATSKSASSANRTYKTAKEAKA